MALPRVLIVSIAANLMNCPKNAVSVGAYQHAVRCFLPACLSSGSAVALVEAAHSNWQSQQKGPWTQLRRTRPQLPCFLWLPGAQRGGGGGAGVGQDSVAGRALGSSLSPQLGRLSTEIRQGHPRLWATCDASRLGS